MKELKHLKASAEKNQYLFDNPDSKLLECFDAPGGTQIISIIVPEFTSLCPITKQPDYARIKIYYMPHKKCIESKSLKLYLNGFRMFGEFHESCINRICEDIFEIIDPQWIVVKGIFAPRGGISFHPISSNGDMDSAIISEVLKEERY